MTLKYRRFLPALAAAWALSAMTLQECHAAPPERETTKLLITLAASEKVNPDEKKRAAPIEVSVYELKNPQPFEQADYFSLYQKDKSILGPDLLKKESYILRPGERRVIERKSDQETTAVGVLAGYRELGQSVWRAVFRLKEAPEAAWYRTLIPGNKAELEIKLEEQGIAITDLKK